MEDLIDATRNVLKNEPVNELLNPSKIMRRIGNKFDDMISNKRCRNCYHWFMTRKIGVGNYEGRCRVNYVRKNSNDGKNCNRFVKKDSN